VAHDTANQAGSAATLCFVYKRKVPTASSNVRVREQSGKHMLVLSSSECTFETCRRTVKMSARWREADVGQIPTSAKHQAQAPSRREGARGAAEDLTFQGGSLWRMS